MPAGLIVAFAAALAAASGVEEVRLERTPCYGRCPVDVLLIRRGGFAQYTGYRNAPRVGHYRLAVPRDFSRVVALIEKGTFEKLPPSTGDWNIDSSQTIVSVIRKGSAKTVVHNLGRAPSPDHAAIMAALEAIVDQRSWKAVESGIAGTALWAAEGQPLEPPSKSNLPGLTLRVRPLHSDETFVLLTDGAGHFRIPLLPGVYAIDDLGGLSDPTEIRVPAGSYVQTQVPIILRRARSKREGG